MNFSNNLTIKRKVLIIFCAILASLTLFLGVTLPAIIENAYAVDNTPKVVADESARDGEVTIKARHDYHTLTASLRSGAKIYAGKTTAGQLKRNLIVSGNFNVGSSSPEVKLYPDEYTLSYTVGTNTYEVSDADIVLSAVPSSAVTITVTSNGQSASFVVADGVIADVDAVIPQYDSITVSALSGISSDYTAETLIYANGFCITGVKDGEKQTISNYEFVEISMDPIPLNATGHEFTVTYINPDGSRLSAGGTINNIARPQILTAVLQVNPDYTQKGNYWYNGDKSVFVNGMTRADFLNGLILTVYYENGERQLDLSKLGNSASYNFPTGETVSISNGFEFNSQESQITFPLTVSLDSQNINTSVTVQLESRQVASIAVDPQYLSGGVFNFDGELYPYSSTSSLSESLAGKVIATYNDGSTGSLSSGLSISGSFTPTAQSVIDYNTNGTSVYNKTVSLIYDNVSTDVTVKVNYIAPYSVSEDLNISPSLVTQYMRTGFDLSNIYVTIRYRSSGSTVRINAPVAEFIDDENNFVEVTYLNSDGEELTGIKEFNKNVESVNIKFRYEGDEWIVDETFSRSTDVGEKLVVEKLPLSLPDVGVLNVNYRQNLTKDITFADGFDEAAKQNLSITVTDENGGATDNASIDGTQVKFSAAGTYKLHFTISEADREEVRWNETNLPNGVEINGDELIYTIVVSPTEVKVKVQLENTSLIYGEQIQYSIWIAALGTNDWFELTDEIKDATKTTVTVRYFGSDATQYTSEPRNVGTYYVQAEISSQAYNAEPSDAPNYTAPDFGAPHYVINPKALDAGAVNTIAYDGQQHGIGDFLTALNGAGFEYGENAQTLISGTPLLTAADKDKNDVTNKKYTHVSDSESITLKINSDNYYWKSDDATDTTKKEQEIEIKITPLELGLEITNEGNLGFIYGGVTNSGQLSQLPSPSLNKTAADCSGNNLGAGRFYAVVPAVYAYYYADDFDITNGKPKTGVTALTNADFASWDYKGENGYVVYIQTDLGSNDRDGDYNLPSAYAMFTISRCQIDLVSFDKDGQNSTYTASDVSLALSNWQSGKMTVAVTSAVTAADSSVDNSDGTVKVRHAATYTITVTLNNNYDWNIADAEDEKNFHYEVEFTYTVDKKSLDISLDTDRFNYDGSEHKPTVTLTGISGTELEIVSTAVYSDDRLENVVSRPINIATYYIAATSWQAKASGGYDVANNYKISYLTYSIITTALQKPELTANGGIISGSKQDTVTVIYKAEAFDFTEFIKDYSENYVYNGSLSNLNIVITANESGRRDMIDVNSYNLVITPADNFKWATVGNDNDTSEVNFTFVIDVKPLTGVNWGNTSFTYNGEEQLPTATPTGLFASDEGYVGVNVTGGKTDAGTGYTAIAASLKQGTSGNRSYNYSLPDTKPTTLFNIAQRAINMPTITGGTDLEFGRDSVLQFNTQAGFTGVTGWSWQSVVTYTVSGVYKFDGLESGIYKFDEINKPHATDGNGNAAGTGFNFDTGEFSFVNAGTYTLTFKITDGNYCWNGADGTDYSITDISVKRQEITAPKLVNPDDANETGRTLERDGNERKPDYQPKNNIFDISYGVFNSADKTYGGAQTTFTDVGEYYICFTVNATNYLNYVFVENTADRDNIGFVTQYGQSEYSQTAVKIYLNYRITQKILDIKYTVGGYTYGDNGDVSDKIGIEDIFQLCGDDYGQLETNYPGVIYTQTITFTDSTGKTAGTVIIDGTEISYGEDDHSALENYLPWNADIYTVRTKIEFTGGQLNELLDEYTLVVTPLSLQVDWYKDSVKLEDGEIPEFVYDANGHTLTAVISNAPQRAEGESEVPTLTVVNNDGGALPVNASEAAYTLKVVNPEGNFDISGDITHGIKIIRRTVTVEIIKNGGSEYGYALNIPSDAWEYADGSNQFVSDHAKYVTYKLQQSGSDVTKYNAGNYDIVPILTGEIVGNYNLICNTFGEYVISPREITLSPDAENLSKTYGEEANLYSPAVYKVEYKSAENTDESWLASGDVRANVFTLTSAATAANASVGSYDVIVNKTQNDNYIVHYTADDWLQAYTVGNAAIGVGTPDVIGWTYDAAERSLIGEVVKFGTISLKGDVTEVTYEYSLNGTNWANASGVKLKDVADGGTYYVKLSAANHNPEQFTVNIEIFKQTLTVSLNLHIFYSEESPVTQNFLMNSDNLSDERYTVTGFAGDEDITDVGATGAISYTTNYVKGADAGNYTLMLDVTQLSSGNYDFEKGESSLKVNAVTVIVSVDIKVKYWSLIGKTSPVSSAINLGTHDKNTYGDGYVDISGVQAVDILTYSTAAITVNGDGVVTDMAGVGDYPVSFSALSDNFLISDDSNALFTIENAQLTVATLNGYDGAYDEQYHTMTSVGGAPFAQSFNPEVNDVEEKYFVAASETAVDWNGAGVTAQLPQFRNVGTYYLYYRFSATNHETVSGYRTVIISFTSNSFKTPFGFIGRDTVFENAADVDADAWIYGTGHAKGYESKGEILNAQTFFRLNTDGTEAPIIFTLYYNGNLLEIGGEYHTAQDLFDAVLKSGLFNAGEYKLHYEMAATGNFGAASADRFFSVGKKPLTITAKPVTVTYGENASSADYTEATGYAYTVEGLVSSGLVQAGYEKDTISNVFAGGKLPKFTGEYSIGKIVASYPIAISNSGELSSVNYDYTINGNTLTVTPRKITITVADKSSQYNYNEASGNKITQTDVEGGRQTLNYSDIDGTFYAPDGDVIEFVTSAVGESTTKDVGVYAIFVRFTQAKHKNNYDITIAGSFTKDKADAATDNEQTYGKHDYWQVALADYAEYNSSSLVITNKDEALSCGTYTIVAANLKLKDNVLCWWDEENGEFVRYSETEDIPLSAMTYDGKYKGYTREPEGTNYGNLTITAMYDLGDGNGFSATYVKDVGSYPYIFVIDDANYVYKVGDSNRLIIYAQGINSSVTVDGDPTLSLRQTYKGDNYVLEFTFGGLQNDEIIDLKATVTPSFTDGYDSVYAGLESKIYGTFATKNDAGENAYTLTVRNSGIYTVKFELDPESAAMKNYSYSQTYTFTVERAELKVTANHSVVQYGTQISATGMPQPMTGVNSSYTYVDAINWNEVANDYRFFGFSLVSSVCEIAGAEGKISGTDTDYLDISGVRYGVEGYNASNTQVFGASQQHTILNIQPDKQSIHAFNYNIVTGVDNTAYGKLHVAQRRITVTVNGYDGERADATSFASTIYSGEAQQPEYEKYAADFFGRANDWYGAASADRDNFLESTAIKLTVTNAVNYGNYAMTAYQDDNPAEGRTNNTNYIVTFVNNNTALFHIDKKELRIQVVSAKAQGVENTFDITYGDTTEGYYTVVYYGFVPADGGNSTGEYYNDTNPVKQYSLKDGERRKEIIYSERYSANGTTASGGDYSAWFSHAGERYIIGFADSELDFNNYKVVRINESYAVMTVISRKVTASTSDRVYTEDSDLYGGAHGIQHNAQIIFTDGVNTYYSYENGVIVKDAQGNVKYNGINEAAPAPNNYLSYQYKGTVNGGADNGYNSQTAPDRAGRYSVTVIFDSNIEHYRDFIFDVENQSGATDVSERSVTFEYNISKKAISLDWAPEDIEELTYNDGDEKYIHINSRYVQALTDVHSVQLIKNDNAEPIVKGSGEAPADGEYVITANGFILKIYSVGTYSLIIQFNADAVNNYKWDEEGAMTEYPLVISVYTESFTITKLKMDSWTYYDTDDNGELKEHKPEYELSNGVDVTITFSYSTVTGELPTGVTVGTQFGASVYNSIVNKTTPSTNIPVNAGMYILVASYTGNQYSSTTSYVIFEINRREVQAPVFVQQDEDYIYNGSEQTADILYNPRELTGAYTGNSSLSSNGITLAATDADTYKITFSLNDVRNYKWAEGVTSGTSYTVEWKIKPAEDNAIIWGDEIIVTYGDEITLSARSTYGGNLTEYYYAVRKVSDATIPENTQWTRWTQENHPVGSGEYWVKAVDGGNANYNGCEAAQKITIGKAWLTVTANGWSTYGDGAADRHFSYEISGFVMGEENVTVGNIVYEMEEADKYTAGTYDVWIKASQTKVDGKDIAEGMSADNYYITTAVGEFTVGRRNITVVLGSASSVYGSLIDLSQIEISVISTVGLVEGDSLDDLGITLEPDSGRAVDLTSIFNDVWAYQINAVGYADNENYNITVFNSGTYRVIPLPIYITAESGGGTYDSGDIQGAKITGIYSATADGTIDVREVFGDRAPTFTFNYWGISNDGKWNKSNSDNWTTAPTLAGNYHATAVASNSDNFTLLTSMGTPSVSFTVGKKVVDESVISIAAQPYKNEALTPVVTDNTYNGIYTVGNVSGVTVGTYSVPLTLLDPYNYKWTSVDNAEYYLTFEIVRGDNEFIGTVQMSGWTYLGYNAEANLPSAQIKFGTAEDFVFTYSSAKDGDYSANVPVNAGTYWVKITVPQTDNYYAVTSEPVSFEISKAPLTAPTLAIVTEGEQQNTVYTGARLQFAVDGYDSKTMRIIYDGDTAIGNSVTVFAVNAGNYKVMFSLNDGDNYVWKDGTALDDDGNAVINWSVARKKINKPTPTSNMYMVNGSELTFIPEGFDEQTMNISGNTTTYGGTFDVIVSIKDPVNYEWSDSSVEDVTLNWVVVGWDTVFLIIIGVLGGVAAIAAIAIGIQYIVHKTKKKKELALEAEAAQQAAATLGGEADSAGKGTEGEEQPSTDEQENNETPEEAEGAEGNNETPDGEMNVTESEQLEEQNEESNGETPEQPENTEGNSEPENVTEESESNSQPEENVTEQTDAQEKNGGDTNE